jgi:tetratricopeptide (TPR) repeat protein
MNDDQRRGLSLAREAFELWQQRKDLAGAAELYQQALPLLDLDHYSTPDAYGQYASVLAGLGRHKEARANAQQHLAIELRQYGEDNASSTVAIARHFLAEHCLRCGDAVAALEAVLPSLGIAGKLEGILRVVQAEALLQLGRRDEAIAAGRAGLAGSTSDVQRERIATRLQEVLGGNW